MRDEESARATAIIQSLEEQLREREEERMFAEERWRRESEKERENVRKEVEEE